MSNPNYITELFNVIKNKTRLQIFQEVTNGRCTLEKIQQDLKKAGSQQSQNTINQEYIQPLIAVGLVSEALTKYSATTFGVRVSEQLESFAAYADKLPPQSESHEEELLQFLLTGPKTCEEIKQILSPTIASRILKRLSEAGLVNLPAERSYVFFHRSKRDPSLEQLTPAAQKVYESIPEEGIAADKLAKIAGLSQRRTYKHIRHLKGKKLVFVRNIPRTYNLTEDGQKLATILQTLTKKVEETWGFTEHVTEPAQRGFTTNSFL
jgi:predicted transcriptional regulator